jgi:NaMN:DMB phosphoribosyltransferase
MGNIFIAQFNAPGIYTVVAELTSAQSSACTPPSQAPRDTVYVVVDSLQATNILGVSPFPEAMPASVAVVVACVSNTRQPS